MWCEGKSTKLCRVSTAYSMVKYFPALPHIFVLTESFPMKYGLERSPSTTPCKSSSLFNSTCGKWIFWLELDSQILNSTPDPTGLCPLYMPGHHRRDCFSCFLVPGARHPVSALVSPKPSHVLSSGAISGRSGGAGHGPHCPTQPRILQSPKKHSPQAAESAVSAQDSMTWYQ